MNWLFIWQCKFRNWFPFLFSKYFKYGIIYGTGEKPRLTRGIRIFGSDLWISNALCISTLIMDNFAEKLRSHLSLFDEFSVAKSSPFKRNPHNYNFHRRVKDFTRVSHAHSILQAQFLPKVQSLLTLFSKFSQTNSSHFKEESMWFSYQGKRFQVGLVDLLRWPT